MRKLRKNIHILLEFLCSSECRIWLRMAGKPVAVIATLAVMLWLGAWFDMQIAQHIAHAETNEISEIQALACPAGTEQNGALCYPPCQDGFVGDGPVCYKKCPANYVLDTGLCINGAHVYFTESYGRGAGVPMICATNQEGQGGLCYPRCNSTHYGVGPVCWERCKAGFADHGATCFNNLFNWYFKNTYGRGAGLPLSACPLGLERNGALCYPRCRTGFIGNGPLCLKKCPEGYTLDSGMCIKSAHIYFTDSYGRGAGEVMNSVPEARDETVQTPKDTPVQLQMKHIDLNDDTTKPVIVVQAFSHGRLDDVTYTPNAGFEGVDTMLWKTSDGKHESNVAIATVRVGNIDPNAAPVALDRTVAVTEDTPLRIDVLCTDADNDELFYQLLEKPQHGEYQWIPPNTVIYTPTLNFVGTDSFTFRSHDGQDFSNVSTITLTVAAVNDAPIVVSSLITTTRNNNAAVVLSASDVESDTITYTLVTSPTHGTLRGVIPNLVYIPQPNFVGDDSFQFQARDVHGAATMATANISVLAANNVPLAEGLVLSTTQESAVAVNFAASDADGDELTYRIVTSPTHGALTGAGTDWVYVPNANFVGTETFTFTANDGQEDAPPATVTIDVAAAPNVATLAGIIFEDKNGNGQPDNGEPGAGGLRITLTSSNAQSAAASTQFVTFSDAAGLWQIEAVPFGQYTLRIEAASGVQIAAPLEQTITIDQRGVEQLQPAGVTVTGRSLFLALVTK
jgi:hypothetical protein